MFNSDAEAAKQLKAITEQLCIMNTLLGEIAKALAVKQVPATVTIEQKEP